MTEYKPSKYFNAITLYNFYSKIPNYHIFKLFIRFFELLNFMLFNSSVPSSAIIGKDTFCSHRGMAVVIHKQAVIGDNCTIGTSVVIGGGGKDKPGAPVIGDNVYIGTGAKVLGNVKIGSNVTIGANSVVIKDVEDGCTVVGIPARVISND